MVVDGMVSKGGMVGMMGNRHIRRWVAGGGVLVG